MIRILTVILTLSIAGMAFAADVNLNSNRTEVIKDGHSDGVMLPTAREGGETIETAVPIPGLPFTDTGTTCDNVDDYDEVCTYIGTAPDVVYSYTPVADGLIDIDLCLSSYDTKVFVYENAYTPGAPYACNDDFYFAPPCFTYSSFIGFLPVTGGNTYYIVVDGYQASCGDYQLDIISQDVPPEECVVECPAGALDEGEGPVTDDPDFVNGGCNSVPPVFTALTVPVGDCTTICGIGGWNSDSTSRDTDWYEFTATTTSTGIKFQAENIFDIYLLTSGDCDNIGLVDTFSTGPCDDALEYTFTTDVGTTYWLFVGVQGFDGTGSRHDYVMSLCGFDVVSTENETWGGVKSLYR